MCVYTFQLEPVFVFISLKLVKDYIFLIENNFTMIQKKEETKIVRSVDDILRELDDNLKIAFDKSVKALVN